MRAVCQSVRRWSIMFRGDPRVADIRIDYVQHALCAWLRYQKMFSGSAGPRGRAR
jgi:hypothetical protein